jgi:hypothetical protein
MRRLFPLLGLLVLGCGGEDKPPAKAPSPPPAAAAPTPVVAEPAATPPPPAAPAETSDPPPIPADKLNAYLAIWKEWFAKENGITADELGKRVVVKKFESTTRNYSRTYLEVKLDVTSEWASVHGAASELLARIKARSSDPPPAVRYDVWLEPDDYAAMKKANALLTTKYNFGKLRFPKKTDAENATGRACKSKQRVHEFQVAIAGDGDPWLISLFQGDKSKENWPCGVDLVKNKGGELMNFDAGDSAFK